MAVVNGKRDLESLVKDSPIPGIFISVSVKSTRPARIPVRSYIAHPGRNKKISPKIRLTKPITTLNPVSQLLSFKILSEMLLTFIKVEVAKIIPAAILDKSNIVSIW